MSKSEEIYHFMQRQTRAALVEWIASTSDRQSAEIIRQNLNYICNSVGDQVAKEYSFLELADIMEWKRTRTKRN